MRCTEPFVIPSVCSFSLFKIYMKKILNKFGGRLKANPAQGIIPFTPGSIEDHLKVNVLIYISMIL